MKTLKIVVRKKNMSKRIQRIMTNPLLLILLRIVIGGLFFYAGFVKIIHPDRFAEQIMVYKILPWSLVNIFAIWLSCLEILVGVLVVAGIWVRSYSVLLCGLLVLFIMAISSALARGISLHCGCFSTASSGSARTWASLWQEGLMLIGCIWLWTTAKKV